jgi:ATP-dependent DNA helicase RecQ
MDAQKIFSCIYRMRERFGINLVAEVLKGSRNKKVLELQFDQLSTYGLMKNLSVQEIKDRINYLITEDYLRLSTGEYPVVKLEQKSVPVLKGETLVYQKMPRKVEKKNSDPQSLFERLRSLRRSLAEQEKIPPYMIFSDKTIREMAESCPVERTMFLRINGVGERKLEKYGTAFLQEIQSYLEENRALTMNTIQQEEESKVHLVLPVEKIIKRTEHDKTPSHHLTLILHKEGKTIVEIAKIRSLNSSTIENHLIRCSEEGLDIIWDDLIPEGQESLILEAIQQAGHEKLRPIKDLLPTEIDWLVIKAVLAKHKIV